MRNHSTPNGSDGYVFIPTLDEILNNKINVTYNTSSDTYFRQSKSNHVHDASQIEPGWHSLTYHADGIRRCVDNLKDETYLDRDSRSSHSSLSWRFDLTSCGLVVDEVKIALEFIEHNGGHVTMNLIGNTTNQSAPFFDRDISSGVITSLKDATVLTVIVNLIGEGTNETTKLFRQPMFASPAERPMKIEISMKRPYVALGRSLLLVGLRMSKKGENNGYLKDPMANTVDRDYCLLGVHVHQAKRLPCRSSSAVPDPVVKLSLTQHVGKSRFKTPRLKKQLNPQWDYMAIYRNLFETDFDRKDLLLSVLHSGLIGRKEILGCVVLGSEKKTRGDSLSDNDDVFAEEATPMKVTNSAKMRRAGSLPTILEDFSSRPSPSQDDPSSNSMMQNIKHDIKSSSDTALSPQINRRESFEQQTTRRRSFPFLNRKPKRPKQFVQNHPKIIVTNSIESIVVYEHKGKQRKKSNQLQRRGYRSQSLSDLLTINGLADREASISPIVTRRGEMIQSQNDPELIRYARQQSICHWKCMRENEGEWIYSWHPLLT